MQKVKNIPVFNLFFFDFRRQGLIFHFLQNFWYGMLADLNMLKLQKNNSEKEINFKASC